MGGWGEASQLAPSSAGSWVEEAGLADSDRPFPDSLTAPVPESSICWVAAEKASR